MILIETNRTGYSPEQCGYTMTVGDLISHLQNFDKDEKVYLSNDNGYSYGHIRDSSIAPAEEDDENEEPNPNASCGGPCTNCGACRPY